MNGDAQFKQFKTLKMSKSSVWQIDWHDHLFEIHYESTSLFQIVMVSVYMALASNNV